MLSALWPFNGLHLPTNCLLRSVPLRVNIEPKHMPSSLSAATQNIPSYSGLSWGIDLGCPSTLVESC